MQHWQWWDDYKWVDYPQATCTLLDQQKPPFKTDVDAERYVKSTDLAKICSIFGDLPQDATGLCALQHRKDNPHRVRLVRNLPDTPLFTEAFFFADFTFDTPVAKQHVDKLAAVNGARLVRYTKADVVIMDFQPALLDITRKVVKHCEKHNVPIVESKWVFESVTKGAVVDRTPFTITQKYITHVANTPHAVSTKKNAMKVAPPPVFFAGGGDSGDDDEENTITPSDEYVPSEEEDQEPFQAPVVAPWAPPPQPAVPQISIKNATFEGELIYTMLENEKYDFQIHFTDDVDVKGVLTWVSLKNSQTRFTGTRTGNTIELKETEVVRGADMVELGEYVLTVVSKNSVKGTIKGDQTAQFHAERILPSKRVPLLPSDTPPEKKTVS